jgi:diaminopimelate epimerase
LSKSRWPLPFAKYSGAGNDFIIIDGRDNEPVGDPGSLAKALCRRGRSVGADGLIVVGPADADDETGSLARMRLWNADGSDAEISANGARCVARFLVDTGADAGSIRFDSDVGPITASVEGDICRLQLPTRARVYPSRRLRVEGRDVTGTYVEVGVPFFVCFHENPDDLAVRFLGRAIRNHPQLAPRGANVDFARVEDDQRLYFRVYERGVEDETLSSGTGSISAALAAAAVGRVSSPVVCVARGAELTVRFRRPTPTEPGAAAPEEEAPATDARAATDSDAAADTGAPAADSGATTDSGAPTGDESASADTGDEGTDQEAADDSQLPPLLRTDGVESIEFVDLEIEGDAMPIYRGEAMVQASRSPRRS